MNKYIIYAAVAGILLLILWPYLFPSGEEATSAIAPSSTGTGYSYTDATGTEVTTIGAQTIQYDVPTGTGILDAPIKPNLTLPASPIATLRKNG